MLDSNKTLVFLLVEDVAVNRMLLKKLISVRFGNAQIHEATNGFEALDKLDSVEPDIIFTDVQMPLLDGLETTRAIKKIDTLKRIPIVALTAGITSDEKQACLDAGMSDYLIKPISAADIETIFLKYLS